MAAWVPAVGGGVDWDPFHRIRRRVFQQFPGMVLHGSWVMLGLCICPSYLDNFHTASYELV